MYVVAIQRTSSSYGYAKEVTASCRPRELCHVCGRTSTTRRPQSGLRQRRSPGDLTADRRRLTISGNGQRSTVNGQTTRRVPLR